MRTARPCAPTPSRTPCGRSGHLWTPPTPAPLGARGSLYWRTRCGGPSSSPSTLPPASYGGEPLLLDLVGGEERLCRSVKTDGRLA